MSVIYKVGVSLERDIAICFADGALEQLSDDGSTVEPNVVFLSRILPILPAVIGAINGGKKFAGLSDSELREAKRSSDYQEFLVEYDGNGNPLMLNMTKH